MITLRKTSHRRSTFKPAFDLDYRRGERRVYTKRQHRRWRWASIYVSRVPQRRET